MLNWLGILVAVVWAQVLGYLWYGPFFGKSWMKLAGVSAGKPDGGTMFLGIFQAAITAAVLSVFVSFLTVSFLEGMMVGFVIWAGFIATGSLGMVLWEKKPFNLWLLNNAYSMVSYVVMGGLLAVL